MYLKSSIEELEKRSVHTYLKYTAQERENIIVQERKSVKCSSSSDSGDKCNTARMDNNRRKLSFLGFNPTRVSLIVFGF